MDNLLAAAAAKKEPPFLLILDGLEDPHNFGAILRTAEAAGVHGLVIRKARQVPVTETVVKVSTGAANLVPVARVPNIAEAIRRLQDEGITVFGLEIDGTRLYNQADYRGGVAFVVGSEGAGLARLVKERCSEVVRLPMRGKINSLNASVATGIVLYEVLRQRSLDGSRDEEVK
ncbi:MAG: 23S rRNA (guanosine(2251)-2'-O)-methyltransferase RlmB [Candidatus Margulisbacteria bacterium]|nr:23S rRNA (guanosine(2251)-2'-O)-methyltransferase RlmB [Candidatus Margulisiibacteriota bacterium]